MHRIQDNQDQQGKEREDDPPHKGNHGEDNVDHKCRLPRKNDRLPAVEAYFGFLVVGRDHQEDDRRNQCEVRKAGSGIVAKAGLDSFFRHAFSFWFEDAIGIWGIRAQEVVRFERG